ncbi:MAG: methyltransferase domain-containing protein [Anaerolineaceae bacterium]|jgi:SAM-dependent methyltransferase
MSDAHQHPRSDQVHFIEAQSVTLVDFPAEGFILDIGGGGEGIIGQLKGAQVVAIDPNKRELAEAPAGPLKIIMDGSQLNFLEATFQTATAFFSFMFIPPALHEKIIAEAFRVLAPGGHFKVWDVVIPPWGNDAEEYFAIRLEIHLPDGEVSTSYGLPWPAEGYDLEHYLRAAQEAGFDVATQEQKGMLFYLELEKSGFNPIFEPTSANDS